MKPHTGKPLDRWAIALSAGCLLHCLLPPALVASGLLLGVGRTIDSPWIHMALLVLVAPLSLVALLNGLRHHHRRLPLALGGSALLLLVLGETLLHDAETALVVGGSLMLIWAHASNLHHVRRH